MDENKATNTNPESGAGEKTFSQDDVNRIVGERLAAEKRKGEAALAEREQQLAQRELLLTVKEELTKAGLPVELADALNVSSPEAMKKAINTVKAVIDEIKEDRPKPVFKGAVPGMSLCPPKADGGNSSLRAAMGLS